MSSEEARPYRTVSRRTWRRMLALGHEWDINKGGLYDSRAGVVNVWVSPEDHPSPSWDGIQITQGALAYPRSYLGAVQGEYDLMDTVTLTLEVTPYDRFVGASTGHYPPPTEDEWAWLRAKADALVDAAERLLEPPLAGKEDSVQPTSFAISCQQCGYTWDWTPRGQGDLALAPTSPRIQCPGCKRGANFPKRAPLQCARCKYRWTPLVPRPITCPGCGSYHWQTKRILRKRRRAS